jgi:hypothetical protein
MKEEKEDSIDKLFRGGLENSGDNVSYQEEDWDKLEGMLNGNKPKGVVRSIIYLIGVVAAMLLLVTGWLFFAPGNKPAIQPQVVKNQPQVQKDSGIYGSPSQQLADRKNTLSDSAQTRKSAVDNIRTSNPFFTLSARDGNRTITGFTPATGVQSAVTAPAQPDTIITDTNNGIAANTPVKPDTITGANKNLAANTAIKKDTITDKVLKPSPANTLATVTDDIKAKKIKIRSAGVGFKPTVSLGIIASPDINSVKTFTDSKVGTNAGLIVTLNFAKRWNVSTGAVYADKPYNADFASYQTNYVFQTVHLSSVTASCMVIRYTTVNVGYQFYSKNRNKFSVGTGLSSYFMLRENYTFNHAERQWLQHPRPMALQHQKSKSAPVWHTQYQCNLPARGKFKV